MRTINELEELIIEAEFNVATARLNVQEIKKQLTSAETELIGAKLHKDNLIEELRISVHKAGLTKI